MTMLILLSAFVVNSEKINAQLQKYCVLLTIRHLLVDHWPTIIVRTYQMETSYDQEKPKRSNVLPTIASKCTR